MYTKGIRSLCAGILLLVLMTGCTTIGTHVLSNPATYLSDSRLSDADLEHFDTEKRHVCVADKSACLAYLYAKAYEAEDFEEGQYVQYRVHASGNGVENEVTFSTTAENFNRMPGTAVLFHGFGGSKEAMLVTSIWFRALGMDVIAFDLFGHGDSAQDFAFGAKEHQLFAAALTKLNQDKSLTEPVITVGHSMGALPATNTLMTSELVKSAIIMAPMVQFDNAAKHYLAYKSPMLNSLFSDSMDDIVTRALQNQQVALSDTNIQSKLTLTDKPVLIMSSDVDTVSPPETFSDLNNSNVRQEIISNRSHPSLIAFDNQDSAIVENWLSRNFSNKD